MPNPNTYVLNIKAKIRHITRTFCRAKAPRVCTLVFIMTALLSSKQQLGTSRTVTSSSDWLFVKVAVCRVTPGPQ